MGLVAETPLDQISDVSVEVKKEDDGLEMHRIALTLKDGPPLLCMCLALTDRPRP